MPFLRLSNFGYKVQNCKESVTIEANNELVLAGQIENKYGDRSKYAVGLFYLTCPGDFVEDFLHLSLHDGRVDHAKLGNPLNGLPITFNGDPIIAAAMAARAIRKQLKTGHIGIPISMQKVCGVDLWLTNINVKPKGLSPGRRHLGTWIATNIIR